MEINKESINLRSMEAKVNSNVMLEGDIVVPDIKPDIREILLADAHAVTQGKEYQNGLLRIFGTVFFKILYVPDENDGCELKSLEASFPFSDSIEIPKGEELKFFVTARTEHIGFTLVNSRKLSMKVITALSARGYRENAYEPVSSISGDGVQCRTKRYNMYMPVTEEQTTIAVSDFLTIPEALPDIEEILKIDAWATAGESKIMNGKVMVKGTLHIKTLYSAVRDGYTTEVVSHELPFAEIIEAEGVDEECTICVDCDIKEITASAKGNMSGDTKIISVEILTGIHLKASKSAQETLIDDCYSICGPLSTKTRSMDFCEFITTENGEFTETQTVLIPKGVAMENFIWVSCTPILRETSFENGMLHMKGTLVTFLLFREEGEKGRVRSIITESDFDRQKPASGEDLLAECDIWIEDVIAEKRSQEEAEVKVTLGFHADILRPRRASLITECEMLEEKEAKSCPALTIYFTEHGDTLWNIAKKYGTTVEKIKKANGMEDDALAVGKKILIPRAC